MIEPGDSLIIDVEIDQSHLPEARTYDLVFAVYQRVQNTGFRVNVQKLVVFNGSFNVPAHPCFVKTSPRINPTFEPTADEIELIEAREDLNIQHLHIYVDGHRLDSATIAPHEVDVTGKSSVKVKKERPLMPGRTHPLGRMCILTERDGRGRLLWGEHCY